MTTLSPPPLVEPVLDESQRETILQLATDGFNLDDVARIVGCEPITIASAIQQDRKFGVDLALAEDALRRNAIQTLNRVVVQDKYWRAAGWVAERLMPGKFGRRKLEPLPAAAVQETSGELGSMLLATAPSKATAAPAPASKAEEASAAAPAAAKAACAPAASVAKNGSVQQPTPARGVSRPPLFVEKSLLDRGSALLDLPIRAPDVLGHCMDISIAPVKAPSDAERQAKPNRKKRRGK